MGEYYKWINSQLPLQESLHDKKKKAKKQVSSLTWVPMPVA